MQMRGFPACAAALLAAALALPAAAQDGGGRQQQVRDGDRANGIDQAVIDRLVSELGAPKFGVRERAEQRLIQLGPVCVRRLRWWLTRRIDAETRHRLRRICERLGWLDPAEAGRRIRAARAGLLSTDPRAAQASRTLILRIGHFCMDAVRELACTDRDWRVRRALAELLPRIWSPTVPAVLIAQLGDADDFVRLGAGSALQRLTGQSIPSFKVKAWTAWWAKAKKTWRPPGPAPRPLPRPTPGPTPRHR